MTDVTFFRQRFQFEREFGQYRNWWVRDPRIAGNPLTIYLYLLSHDPDRMPTQTEARKALSMGKDAWNSAKTKLLRAGFLLEVRDRFPAGYIDLAGQPRGGQNRYRLELLDPEPGVNYELEDVVIELETSLDEYKKIPDKNRCGKPAPGAENRGGKPDAASKPLIRTGAENPHRAKPAAGFPPPFIGREKDRKDWINNPSLQSSPSEPDAGAREREFVIDAAEVDAELQAIDHRLSVAALERELSGRVPVGEVDLVRACRSILASSKLTAAELSWPAAYVAKSVVSNPERWRPGFGPHTAAATAESTREARTASLLIERDACSRGDHDWGPATWPVFDRAHCVRDHCLKPRREVDAEFAALEAAEFERSQ